MIKGETKLGEETNQRASLRVKREKTRYRKRNLGAKNQQKICKEDVIKLKIKVHLVKLIKGLDKIKKRKMR